MHSPQLSSSRQPALGLIVKRRNGSQASSAQALELAAELRTLRLQMPRGRKVRARASTAQARALFALIGRCRSGGGAAATTIDQHARRGQRARLLRFPCVPYLQRIRPTWTSTANLRMPANSKGPTPVESGGRLAAAGASKGGGVVGRVSMTDASLPQAVLCARAPAAWLRKEVEGHITGGGEPLTTMAAACGWHWGLAAWAVVRPPVVESRWRAIIHPRAQRLAQRCATPSAAVRSAVAVDILQYYSKPLPFATAKTNRTLLTGFPGLTLSC